MSDYIRDFGETTFFVKSKNRFVKRGSALLTKLDFGAFAKIPNDLLGENKKGEMDADKPYIFYGNPESKTDSLFDVFESTIQDKSLVLQRARANSRPAKLEDWNRPIDLNSPPLEPRFFFDSYFGEAPVGIVDKQQFASSNEMKLLAKWRSSQLLKRRLPQRTLALIDRSGVGAVFTDKASFYDFSHIISETELDEAEKNVQTQLLELGEAAQMFVAGSTFANESLEISLHTQFKQNNAVAKIFDLAKTEQPFQSTWGLPQKGLIASVSANLESLRSPSVIRVLLRLASEKFGASQVWRPIGIDSALMNFTGEWISEAWHYAASIRSGLYIVDEGKKTEALSIIAIIEPRNPDAFIDELSQIMVLVDKSNTAGIDEARETELQKWIVELDDDSYENRKRATMRLMLAGVAAEPILEKAVKSGTPEQRMRIQMVLRDLRTNAQQAANTLLSEQGQIWHKTQPSFSLRKDAGVIGDYELHEILITPDPKLGNNLQTRYKQEMKSMFGPRWSTVKLVRIKERFILMLGSSESSLKEAVKNVANGKDPIRSLLANTNRNHTDHGQIEINASISRLLNMINFDKPEKHLVPDDNDISSSGLAFDKQTWELTLHFPIEELRRLSKPWFNP